MPDIFINTERPVDRSIVAGLNQPQREAAASAWVAGSSYDVNLYFVQNDGTYDAASGQAGQTVELAIAPVSEPESGTFTLTDGTDTTAALSFGASGQDVEDALNALNSDTGPNLGTASLVDVEKVSDTQYAITFRTLGAMTALSGASVSLYPESTVTGSIAVTGSGTQYAQQVIEVVRQPAIYQPTWSTITNGFNATVALNTTRLLQAMVLERGEPFFLEIRLNGTTVAREVVTVEESNMPASAFSGTAIASVLDVFAADPTTNAYFDADAWNSALSIAAGNGDVVGPASAVDGNFAAFDTTTGKLIKDALVSASSFATAAQGALADSASQPGHTHTASDVTDFDAEVSNNTTVAGNENYTPRVLSGTAKTATFTAVIGETHLVNTSASGFTANLPAIAGGQGRIAFLFTGTGGNLTVDPSGAETIGGKATLRLDHGHNTIENDGTEWKLVQRSGVAPFRIDPAQITANQDGYNPADWNNNVTHLFIDSDASREIQGFEEDGFHDMAQVIVTNDGSNDIIIKHDTSTTVANRVLVDGGADFTLGANQTGILMRDGTVNKWRFYGINQDLTSYQLKPAEGAFVDGDKTKLDGIETGADVTDSTNVVSALDSAVLTDAGTPAATDQVLIKDAGTGALQTADFSDFGGGGDVATDTIWDAAGDLAIGTGADTAARLAIGTNGQVLTSNGTTATWAAPTGGATETAETSIWIDAGAMLPDATAEASSKTGTNGNVDVFLMANTEKVYAKWTPPPQWDGGTIDVDIYWTATGATAGHKVKWNIAAQAGGNDDAWDVAFPTPTATADDDVIASGDIHIISATSITVGGTPADGDCVFFEIERTASGATQMSQEAELLGIRVNYQNSLMQNWYSWKLGNETSDATTGIKSTWYAPAAGKIYSARGGATTATSGGATTVDVHKGGTTIFSTYKLIFETGESSIETTTNKPTLTTDPTTFAAGDKFEFEVDSTTAGAAGLHVDLLISWD